MEVKMLKIAAQTLSFTFVVFLLYELLGVAETSLINQGDSTIYHKHDRFVLHPCWNASPTSDWLVKIHAKAIDKAAGSDSYRSGQAGDADDATRRPKLAFRGHRKASETLQPFQPYNVRVFNPSPYEIDVLVLIRQWNGSDCGLGQLTRNVESELQYSFFNDILSRDNQYENCYLRTPATLKSRSSLGLKYTSPQCGCVSLSVFFAYEQNGRAHFVPANPSDQRLHRILCVRPITSIKRQNDKELENPSAQTAEISQVGKALPPHKTRNRFAEIKRRREQIEALKNKHKEANVKIEMAENTEVENIDIETDLTESEIEENEESSGEDYEEEEESDEDDYEDDESSEEESSEEENSEEDYEDEGSSEEESSEEDSSEEDYEEENSEEEYEDEEENNEEQENQKDQENFIELAYQNTASNSVSENRPITAARLGKRHRLSQPRRRRPIANRTEKLQRLTEGGERKRQSKLAVPRKSTGNLAKALRLCCRQGIKRKRLLAFQDETNGNNSSSNRCNATPSGLVRYTRRKFKVAEMFCRRRFSRCCHAGGRPEALKQQQKNGIRRRRLNLKRESRSKPISN